MARAGEVWFPEPGRIRRARDGRLLDVTGQAVLTPWLPHEQRPRAELIAAPRKVMAHKMQTTFLSIANDAAPDYYKRKFMPPGGQEGTTTDHSVYGGFWRARPYEMARPRPETDWELADQVDEVRLAIAMGLDGWHHDILTAQGTSRNWLRGTEKMMTAAERPEFAGLGFTVAPMIDGTASIGTSVSNAIRSIGAIIKRPSIYKRDGRPVVWSFAPESVSGTAGDQDWWQQLRDGVLSTYGVDIAFWGVINGTYRTHAPLFDALPFSIGTGRWGGNRDWANATETISVDVSQAPAWARANLRGNLYCYPSAAQDCRFDQGRFWEAWCTEALRGSMTQARLGKAEFVQIITWSDFRETGVMPSDTGPGWADLYSFYIEWYKFDAPPPIARACIFLTHREHRADLPTTSIQSTAQTKFTVRDSGGATKYDVEALVFTTQPIDVVLDVAGVVTTTPVTQAMIDAAGGGPVSVKKPHHVGANGQVSARGVRNGVVVPGTTVLSPVRLTTSPLVQNFWYHCSNSLRQVA